MNREEEIKRWQASIDDDLLEEAQRPLPRGSATLRWGGLAACLCAAALALALALPGHGAAETEDCGAAPDGCWPPYSRSHCAGSRPGPPPQRRRP